MKIKFRYECVCGGEPTYGDMSGPQSKCEITIGIVEQAWLQDHSKPGCLPIEQARKNKVNP